MTSSTRSESPVDVDFSVIRTSIQMGHKMVDQILNGIHYGSDEVRNLLREECDFILECKVCRNLFRSFPNFVAHKRVYCIQYYEENKEKDNLASTCLDEETIVIQPEAPEENSPDIKNDSCKTRNASTINSNIDKVINRTFDGKSNDYHFYTKVAEDLEKRKATKVTNTVTLTSIATNSNAVLVSHSKGDKSSESLPSSSPKKQSPMKSNTISMIDNSPKKKNTVLDVCMGLANKRILQGIRDQASGGPVRLSTRSRKSSPRKSIDYLENTNSGNENKIGNTIDMEYDIDLADWIDDDDASHGKGKADCIDDKELLKYCDVKNFICKICKRSYSSLYNVKLHAKMKHVNAVVQYGCPVCDFTFGYFSSLARHIRRIHRKSQSYINNLRMKQHHRESTEHMETADVNDTSGTSTINTSPEKVTGNLLSCSTGWKKCDKCDKICWKAKSFYRHYASCKGPLTKPNSKSSTVSPVKSCKQNCGNENQRNTTALMRLQEKLRAGLIQAGTTDDDDRKTKLKEKVTKDGASENYMKMNNKLTEKPSERNINNSNSELYRALLRPLNVIETDTSKLKENDTTGAKDIIRTKTYNLRLSSQGADQEEELCDNIEDQQEKAETKYREEISQLNESPVTNGSPGFKQLEERLVREAGIKESQKTENDADSTSKPYSTRQAVKSNVVDMDENNLKVRNQEEEDSATKVKGHRLVRESPEIKQLEEKLTREALGHKEAEENVNKDDFCHSKKEDNMSLDDTGGEKLKTSIHPKDDSVNKLEQKLIPEVAEGEQEPVHQGEQEPVPVETRTCTTRTSSKEAESRKERISEKLREQMAQQESSVPSSKPGASTNISREADSRKDKISDRTPEKMHLVNLQPVSSPTRTVSVPSSPTPSMHSTHADSYNMKFKMTVQEMAELVESASLTKFAKERKKRAKNILNTKQVKESQNITASLSKPMKKRVRNRNIILRNVYGTRNKVSNSPDDRKKHSTRFSTDITDDVGYSGVRGRVCNPSREDAAFRRTESDVSYEPSRESSNEMKIENNRLSREQKRLQNSAGFVEKNLYAVSLSCDSSNDVQSDADSEKGRLSRERKRLESSQGFVEKGLLYESDSSIEREKSSRYNKIGSDNYTMLVDKRVITETITCKPKPVISKGYKDNSVVIKTPDKGDARLNKYESKDTEKLKDDDEFKETSSVKKTVLYVGKDFKETIKTIQGKLGKVKFQPESGNMKEHAEMGSKKCTTKKENEELDTDQNVEVNTETVLAKTLLDSENIFEKMETEKNKVNDTSETGNLNEQKGISALQQESPKYRTRLATGSISLDSELLKSSPTKSSKQDNEKLNTDQQVEVNTVNVSTKTLHDSENIFEKLKAEENKVKDTNKTSDLNEQKGKIAKNQESPKHRTRLATGSIFFDSELLKLSPTKIAKKIAELSKTADAKKVKHEKSSISEVTLVKKRLSLSPTKLVTGNNPERLRTTSGPQRYSLSTGVKQCQKCNKHFWKTKAYMSHMTISPCGGKKLSKVGKKRALSLSPERKTFVEVVKGKEIGMKGNSKKVKTEDTPSEWTDDVNNMEKLLKNKKTTGRLSVKWRSQLSGNNVASSERYSSEIDESDNENCKHLNDVSETKGIEHNENTTLDLQSSRCTPSEQDEQTELGHLARHTTVKLVKMKGTISDNEKHIIEGANECQNAVISVAKKDISIREHSNRGNKIEQSENIPDSLKVNVAENVQRKTNRKLLDGIELEVSSNVETDAIELQIESRNTIAKNELQSTDSGNHGVINRKHENRAGLFSSMQMNDEIPGPSTSQTPIVYSEESDNNGSDFSGFSEDDLMVSEQELSQMDEDVEGHYEEFGCDLDFDEYSDDLSEDESDFYRYLKGGTQFVSSSQRPVRKSAQNRFAHVEEIWVYKEPGKPVTEKIKGVKNREYVVDITNPSKLQCHNSKDVDRLIDERKLKCRQCDTPCTSISNLRRHVIRHLGWKRYKCKHCQYTCYDMSYCRQHVLRAHDEHLTSKNFDKYITDLKKEATKKRAAKRTNTLHKTKKSSQDDDTYKKHKPTLTPGQKLNTDLPKPTSLTSVGQTSSLGQSSNIVQVQDDRKTDNSNENSNKVVIADFIGKTETTKSAGVKSETSKRVVSGRTPLFKARKNLTKALSDKI